MEIKYVVLVIVDISGYTNFLRYRNLSLLHAEDIITQLLESVIDAAQYPLILNKLEGDAAFLYAQIEEGQIQAAQDILQQTLAFFPAFRNTAAELSHDTAQCDCDACARIDRLKLKAFIHHGKVVFKKIRQFEELAGEDVILIHRLLKNTIPSDEYILMTNSFSELAGDILNYRKESRTESYENTGQVMVDVYYPSTTIEPTQASQPSFIRKFKMTGSRTRRLLNHIFGNSGAKHFEHIPNHKIDLYDFLKDKFRF